jgi:hypothetical protein
MLIKKIIVIFKTHLDIGFTDFSENVTKKYMESYLPGAAAAAKELKEKNGDARLVWTTGSWLIEEYLRTHTDTEGDAVRKCIENGDICWHGLPFTTHTELMSTELFEYGLSISQKLDKTFGKKTIAAKMTDVPGHTRGIIASLAEHGVRFLQIGVNPATPVPNVPPVFRWMDSLGNSVIVMYQKNYGEMLNFPEYNICAEINVMGDNLGPHSFEKAMNVFQRLEKQFPGTAIRSTTLDELYERIQPYEKQLPIVTDEIGDTWIHGVGSDPWKVAQFKALLRSGVFSGNGETVFTRKLLEIVEHTWGLDEKTFLPDAMQAKGRALSQLKRSAPGRSFAASWAEQRSLIDEAVASLSAADRQKALSALNETVPQKFSSFHGMKGAEKIRRNPFFEFAFSKEDGSICHLKSLKTGRMFASAAHTLGSFESRTLTRHEYDCYLQKYLRINAAWAYQDFEKHFLPYHQQGELKGIAKHSFCQINKSQL